MTEYTHISPATLNKLQDCFNQLDLDKDGIIALDDVVKAMILVGQDQRYQLIKQIIRKYGGKHQQLNFDEFICIFVRPPPIETQSPLQKLFQQLDRNNSGSIGAV